ncbi:MAG: DUF3108 domain-containing protein [Hyphomicrobiales bacterium]|nr:DUF3108 domain-containing protein [Hyphomicrobiales bacterium]
MRLGDKIIRGLCGAQVALAAASVAPAAQAESIKATFAISLIGLTIGQANAVAAVGPDSYRIDVGLRLSGLAALVTKAKGAATASGQIANSTILPAAYANTSANATETRTVRMGLAAGTVRAVDISPPFFDMNERVPVTEAHKTNVFDPISALLMAVPPGKPLTGPSACDRTVPVYDGLVRFNISLTYAGMRQIHGKGYKGPATVCAARYTPISGYKLDSESTKFMAENRNIEAWLIPVENARMVVPYYVSVGTKAGALVVQAVDFEITQDRAQSR